MSSHPTTEYGVVRDTGYKASSEDSLSTQQNKTKDEKNAFDPDAELALTQQTTLHEGEQKFHKLGWKRLTICLIVEAIALGSLSVPSAFATVGMVPGVILCVGLGLIAIYTSHVIGQVKLKYTHVQDYADGVGLIWGKPGYILCSIMFVLFLVLLVGSHVLTGTIAWITIVSKLDLNALIFGVVSAIILFAVALPPTFAEFAILGYIDFVSIICAIMITIIATGIESAGKPGGLSAVDWALWPAPGTSFYSAFLSVTNIIFAYSFAVCQFSFMSEMHRPKDYIKSIWALGLIEIFIYTVTGALVYAFVGSGVRSPALLSASPTVQRIAFGVALPVIFISGSINGTVAGKYLMGKMFKNSEIRFINTPRAWGIWIALIAFLTIIAFVIAEAIPFFNALLGLISSLFISGFTFYFPALFWFQLVKEGKWNANRHNILLSILNAGVLIIGLLVLVCGTYASVEDILHQYSDGSVRSPFSGSSESYVST